ncbi:MAG TPA: hypothetical protein VFX74_00680, partial [Candidatus Limnocylindria bacterium]|nr:hypothetical protein [Candidatus Limnocylindria bacterium]
MTRAVSDPHRAFGEWLVQEAPGEPPRDAALHASVCSECLRRVTALDALAEVDVGRALLPASRVMARPAGRNGRPSLRWASAAAAGVVGLAIVGLNAPRLFAGRPLPSDGATGAVLGTVGTPVPTASAAINGFETATATPRESSTARPAETEPATP